MDLADKEHPEGLAAYALDGLGPEEAAAVREHTAHCHGCRQELGEFAEVKALLDQVPLEALLGSSLMDLDSSLMGGETPALARDRRAYATADADGRLAPGSSGSPCAGPIATWLSKCWCELVAQGAQGVVQPGLDRPR